MITTDFYSETPVLKGKDAERFVENMVNAKPLSKKTNRRDFCRCREIRIKTIQKAEISMLADDFAR